MKVVEQQLEKAVQRRCGVSIPTDIQNSTGHGPEQAALVVGLD